MSINPCKECGGPVSTKAENCPRCGAKVVKSTSVIIIFVVLFVGYLAYTCATYSEQMQINSNNSTTTSAHTVMDHTQTDSPVKFWNYSESKDEMRGETIKFAFNTSQNKADFDFPYAGGSNLHMALRKVEKGNTDVILKISKGQFTCNSYDGCSATVKFDNLPIKEINLIESDNHSPDTLFIKTNKDANWFVAELKKNKVVTVELLFFQEGRRQFNFNVEDLNWQLNTN